MSTTGKWLSTQEYYEKIQRPFLKKISFFFSAVYIGILACLIPATLDLPVFELVILFSAWLGFIFLFYNSLLTTQRDKIISKSFDGVFLCCDWCKASFPTEILRVISLVLEENGFEFKLILRKDLTNTATLQPFVFQTTLIPKIIITPHLTTPKASFVLASENWGIAFFQRTIFQPTWIFLGRTYSSDSVIQSSVSETTIKTKIQRLITNMRSTNSFCRICKGQNKSSCYGGNYVSHWTADPQLKSLLLAIDPYKDRATTKALISRKKRFSETTAKSLEDEIASLSEIHQR